MVGTLGDLGWTKLSFDEEVRRWALHAWQLGQKAMQAPDLAHWWACENTWFVGVDALPNDASGSFAQGPSFPISLQDAVTRNFGPMPDLHPAQLSVVCPGYPKPRDGETPAAFRFRQTRDAAHVDGLRRGGDGGRRVEEPHAWIMGIPLTHNTKEQAPLVVWEGSHMILGRVFRAALQKHPEKCWHSVDLKDVYLTARKQIFETCQRVPVLAQPGEAVLLHRQTLHGVATWEPGGGDSPGGHRAIAYLRPCLAEGVSAWAMPN
ncbi:hypothetical protein [Shimia sp.]|uniref:hypothetical protein n=1 Tax=Shimia sp. TaxID=1954381 RepID=UPI003B8E2017